MILAELEDRERMRELHQPPPGSKPDSALYPVVEDPHAVRPLLVSHVSPVRVLAVRVSRLKVHDCY